MRHRWGGPCTRCLRAGTTGACRESENGNACQGSTCLNCGLHRRRDRFIHDDQSDAKVRRNHMDVPTFYFTASGWTASPHVPSCTPAKAYPVPPVEPKLRMASELTAEEWIAMGWADGDQVSDAEDPAEQWER